MVESTEKNHLGIFQKSLLLIVALLLSFGLFFVKKGLAYKQPLDQLARRSIAPEIALNNGKPTIFEFYADWCEVCQEMAPAMLKVEKINENKIDIVLLNVDNKNWLDLIEEYDVNGIPQLNFFDAAGKLRGKSIGLRNVSEINQLSNALLKNTDFPFLSGVNELPLSEELTSSIQYQYSKNVSPMSHG